MQGKALKAGLAALLFSSMAHAGWKLDGAASSFYYVTTKAGAVAEVNTFSGLSGAIADNGAATLNIDLATVKTSVDVRDQRMRDIVFQVAKFPQVEVAVKVDAAALDKLAAGTMQSGTYPATVKLHGMSAELSAQLQIVKLGNNAVQVHLVKPLLVGAATFGLTEAVEELRMLANLPSISPNVAVEFTLVYTK